MGNFWADTSTTRNSQKISHSMTWIETSTSKWFTKAKKNLLAPYFICDLAPHWNVNNKCWQLEWQRIDQHTLYHKLNIFIQFFSLISKQRNIFRSWEITVTLDDRFNSNAHCFMVGTSVSFHIHWSKDIHYIFLSTTKWEANKMQQYS